MNKWSCASCGDVFETEASDCDACQGMVATLRRLQCERDEARRLAEECRDRLHENLIAPPVLPWEVEK